MARILPGGVDAARSELHRVRGDHYEEGLAGLDDPELSRLGVWLSRLLTFVVGHVTIAFTDDLAVRLDALAALVSRVLVNPYHDREPDT